MYWIYLIMFTFIVFVPTVIQRGFYIFNTVQTQEFVTLILGSLGFFVFLIQEKRLRKNIVEKTDIQRKVNRMAKDLTHSYSYIGEINRKLDILENVTLDFPESQNLTVKKQREIYDSIMEAVKIFGKSDEFVLNFISLPENEVIKEIKSLPNLAFNFSVKNLDVDAQFFESDEFFVTTSPKAIDNIFSCIIVRKKTHNQKFEDLEIMKTLAAQALFLFMFMRRKEFIKCADIPFDSLKETGYTGKVVI